MQTRKASRKKIAKRATRGTAAPRKDGNGTRRVRADDMLSNALRLFAQLGYANATVKAIADAADVNPALLYYYHENKEALFIAALRHAIAAVLDSHEAVDTVDKTEDPTEVICRWFEKNRRLMMPLSQVLKLMLEYRTAGNRITSVERLIADFYNAEMALLSAAIRRGIREGLFRRVDVERTAQFVSTHLDGLVIAATIRPAVDVARSVSHLERILFDYLGVPGEAAAAAHAQPAEAGASAKN